MPLWQVWELDKKGNEVRRVFVRAADKDSARAIGKYGLRVTGRRCRYVRVFGYSPERDYEISRYVKEVQPCKSN